jgi:MFS family permease
MADRFGTRLVFASAIGLFTLGSVLCGVSSDIHLLVVCRILQGCGGAMIQHRDPWPSSDALRYHWAGNAVLADRAAGLLLRGRSLPCNLSA